MAHVRKATPKKPAAPYKLPDAKLPAGVSPAPDSLYRDLTTDVAAPSTIADLLKLLGERTNDLEQNIAALERSLSYVLKADAITATPVHTDMKVESPLAKRLLDHVNWIEQLIRNVDVITCHIDLPIMIEKE